MFLEGRIKPAGRTILLRLEGFNLFNHANILGRAQTTYGDLARREQRPSVSWSAAGTAANALPALANIDPPRMFQFQVRFTFRSDRQRFRGLSANSPLGARQNALAPALDCLRARAGARSRPPAPLAISF